MISNVLEYIEKSANSYPNKTAFVEQEKEITFEQFRKSVKQRAFTLFMKTGAVRQKPIIVLQKKSVDMLINFFAIAWTGNIYVPFDVKAPLERLRKMVDMLQPIGIVTDESYMSMAEKLGENIPVYNMDVLDKYKDTDEDTLQKMKDSIIDTDALYVICTSGSTGTPKGVVISHRSVIDFTEESSEKMEFDQNEKFISQSPFYFDLSVLEIYCTLRNAATLYIVPKTYFSFPMKLMQYIVKHEINALMWAPSALVLIANLGLLYEIDASCLKKIMFCGEVMPNKQLNIWRSAIPNATYVNYYGPAETTCASTYYIVDREFLDEESLPIGKPAYNTGIMVLDEDGKITPKGEVGELYIKGSGIGLGYYNDREKTQKSFVQNPLNNAYREILYRTGDLVKINEKDELIYIGRKDHQIKHMGYRIELGEIENAANAIEGIDMCCCLYNKKKKEIVFLYTGSIEQNDVGEKIRQKVPKYMVPHCIIKLSKMLLNANGKINRPELNQKYIGE